MAVPAFTRRGRFFVPSPTPPARFARCPPPPGGFLSARLSPINHIKLGYQPLNKDNEKMLKCKQILSSSYSLLTHFLTYSYLHPTKILFIFADV